MTTVRKASSKDVPVLAVMNNEFQINEKRFSDKFRRVYSVSQLKKRISRQIKNDNFIFIIAVQGNAAAGFAKAVIESGREYYKGINKMAEISAIYTRKEYRKQRVGLRMYNTIIKELKKRDVDAVTAFVHSPNKPAMNFFISNKFKVISYELRKLLKG